MQKLNAAGMPQERALSGNACSSKSVKQNAVVSAVWMKNNLPDGSKGNGKDTVHESIVCQQNKINVVRPIYMQ